MSSWITLRARRFSSMANAKLRACSRNSADWASCWLRFTSSCFRFAVSDSKGIGRKSTPDWSMSARSSSTMASAAVLSTADFLVLFDLESSFEWSCCWLLMSSTMIVDHLEMGMDKFSMLANLLLSSELLRSSLRSWSFKSSAKRSVRPTRKRVGARSCLTLYDKLWAHVKFERSKSGSWDMSCRQSDSVSPRFNWFSGAT